MLNGKRSPLSGPRLVGVAMMAEQEPELSEVEKLARLVRQILEAVLWLITVGIVLAMIGGALMAIPA